MAISWRPYNGECSVFCEISTDKQKNLTTLLRDEKIGSLAV